MPEGGVVICTDLASATPFAYPCSYNDDGNCFGIVGVVSDDGAIEEAPDCDSVSVPVVVVVFAVVDVVFLTQ